ncbi:MAG: T9SS type A sorting domain-containing protein [Paludibacteraceae bacterium]
MKKLIFLFVLIFSIGIIYSQNVKIEYTYDLDGNLSVRRVVQINIPPGVKRQSEDSTNYVKDDLGNQKITLYPNPTNGLFRVVITGLDYKEKNYYQLFSLDGKLIKQSNISDENINFDISMYSSGVFLLNVYLGKKVSLWKVIKN